MPARLPSSRRSFWKPRRMSSCKDSICFFNWLTKRIAGLRPLLSTRPSGVTSAVHGFRPGEIDYDAPERNARLEQQVAYASVACCDLLRAFEKLTKDTLNKDCVVVCSGANERHSSSPVQSTIGRELEYCIGHALHHFDIIRLICDS